MCCHACVRVGLSDISVVDQIILDFERRNSGRHDDTFDSLSRSTEDMIDSALKVSQVVKGEMSAKTTSKKSYKGIVSIADCSPDGKYITLENVGRREQSLDGWKIVRNVDGKEFATFTFDKNFVLRTASNVKIWTRGSKPFNAALTDLETSFPSWGTGSNVVTLLFDPAGMEQASHHQTTTYSS